MANLWRTTWDQTQTVNPDENYDPRTDANAVWVSLDTGLVTQATAIREFVRLLREWRDSKAVRKVQIAESDVPVPTFTDRTAAVLTQLGITPPPQTPQV